MKNRKKKQKKNYIKGISIGERLPAEVIAKLKKVKGTRR